MARLLCGLAANFFHLLLARIGRLWVRQVPAPHLPMISDMFPPDRRATALGIYALGIPIGTMLGNLSGGWINEAFDWRSAFFVVGLPGVLLAVIVRFTLREPPRGAAEGIQVTSEEAPPIKEVFKYLWARRSFRLISLGAGLHAFVGYGVGYWIPAMFGRSHGFTTGEMGVASIRFASIAGTFLEGI